MSRENEVQFLGVYEKYVLFPLPDCGNEHQMKMSESGGKQQ